MENQTPKSKSLQFRTRTNNSYTLSILAKCTVGSSWWVNSRGRLMCRNLRVVLFLSTVLSAISDSVFKSVSLRSNFSNAVFTYIIKKIGHAYNIPTMQFETGIPRNTVFIFICSPILSTDKFLSAIINGNFLPGNTKILHCRILFYTLCWIKYHGYWVLLNLVSR